MRKFAFAFGACVVTLSIGIPALTQEFTVESTVERAVEQYEHWCGRFSEIKPGRSDSFILRICLVYGARQLELGLERGLVPPEDRALVEAAIRATRERAEQIYPLSPNN